MAAASGSRDGSGPINGTGAGPATGFGALATVDFACAAASFAADVRSPLVSASVAAAAACLGGAFFAAFFLRRLLGCLLRRCFLGRLCRWLLGRRCGRLGGRRDRSWAWRRRGRFRCRCCGVRLFVGSILLVCHLAAPLRLSRLPGSGSHHARSDTAHRSWPARPPRPVRRPSSPVRTATATRAVARCERAAGSHTVLLR